MNGPVTKLPEVCIEDAPRSITRIDSVSRTRLSIRVDLWTYSRGTPELSEASPEYNEDASRLESGYVRSPAILTQGIGTKADPSKVGK